MITTAPAAHAQEWIYSAQSYGYAGGDVRLDRSELGGQHRYDYSGCDTGDYTTYTT